MTIKYRKTSAAVVTGLAAVALLTGCNSDAKTASDNLSKAADNFEVQRRIVLFNGITDKYLMTIEGRCSIEPNGGKVDVTCKIGDNQYKKDYLGLSNNVTYFVEQLDPIDVSVYHTRIIFKPEEIVPDLQLSTGKQ